VAVQEAAIKCNYAQFLRTNPASIKGNHITAALKIKAKVSKKCANNGIFVLTDAQKLTRFVLKNLLKK
jgi:fructose-specific phosphotransferase system IIC component